MAPVSLIFLSVPVRSCASAECAQKPEMARININFAKYIAFLPFLTCDARCVRARSIFGPHITSRRVLDRSEHSAAGLASRHLAFILCFEPLEPIRPPRACMFLGLCQPP